MLSALIEFQNKGVANDLAENRSPKQIGYRGLRSEGEMRT